MADAILQQSKTCTGCKVDKPLFEFHRHKRSKDGVRQRCKSCRAEEVAEDRIKSPEKYKERHRKYYEKHRDKVIARTSEYNRAKPQVLRNSMRAYRADPANRKKELEYGRQYREKTVGQRAAYRKENEISRLMYNQKYRIENKERISAYHQEWKRRNWDACATSWRNRRARKLDAGTHTAEETKDLLIAQRHCCANCEIPIGTTEKHLDHWIPLALGGSNTIENLQWLCPTCNLGKGRTEPIMWLVRQKKACHWPKKY
jgi:5-methylcytosine-specific restriction endonuclease McrA